MKQNLIIIGAGGHGKVIAEAAAEAYYVVGFADDTIPAGTEIINGLKVIANTKETDTIRSAATCFVVAVGNNDTRKKIYDLFSAKLKPATVIHPTAFVSSNATTGSGTVVLANATVNAGAHVEENCIINSHVLVDHDTLIGKHAHIAQGSIIGSNCTLSAMFTSELGQRIKSFTKI